MSKKKRESPHKASLSNSLIMAYSGGLEAAKVKRGHLEDNLGTDGIPYISRNRSSGDDLACGVLNRNSESIRQS